MAVGLVPGLTARLTLLAFQPVDLITQALNLCSAFSISPSPVILVGLKHGAS